MLGTLADRHGRPLALAGAIVYAVFLIAEPFGHHDILCHLKTPLHCTACASSLLGTDPDTLPVPDAWSLADAGRALVFQLLANSILLPFLSTGRSPPVQA